MRRAAWIVGASVAAGALLGTVTPPVSAKDADKELQDKLKDHDLAGEWIYDDVDAAFAAAQRDKRPLMIVFR